VSVDVALVVHDGRDDAVALADETEANLNEKGISVARIGLEALEADDGSARFEELKPSLCVSLGGDGTFLRSARFAHDCDTPILGVNFGRVGYLLDLPPAELDDVIVETLAGRASIERRAGLSITLIEADQTRSFFAVNELSVEKTVPGHVVRLTSSIDGELFLTYSADGMLLSTPAGSTAYNLSAGGPVLAPHLDAFVMTPVAPHLVIDRSVVLGGEQEVSLEVVGDRPAVCVVDGVSVATVAVGTQVRARRHERWLEVVVLADRGVGRRLRESLRQGHE
jgi:NAD+ kinase